MKIQGSASFLSFTLLSPEMDSTNAAITDLPCARYESEVISIPQIIKPGRAIAFRVVMLTEVVGYD